MATLTVNAIRKAGIADIATPMQAADVAGDQVAASSGVMIAVSNADASPHTITVVAPTSTTECGNLGQLPVADITLTVAAGDTGFIAVPLGYAAAGFISWTYDAVTSVTVGAFSIAP